MDTVVSIVCLAILLGVCVWGVRCDVKRIKMQTAKDAEHLALYQDIRRMMEHKCICICHEEEM